MKVSNRILSMPPSLTIGMAQQCRDMKIKGYDVINLGVGEPDFFTPLHIKSAGCNAIEQNYTYYPPVAGYNELKEAIVNKLKEENNLPYEKDQIVVSCGAKHSIFNIILSVINPGDEVIIPAPYWVSYSAISTFAGGKNVFISTDIKSEFKITPEQLKKVVNNKTKVFIFSSPSNPTGSIYTYSELKSLVEVFAENPNILIISDEIYEYINFVGSHQSIAQFKEIKENVVIVNGISKGFAMTGWRLGYMAGPHWLAKACEKLQGQTTSGVNTITQRAAIEALTGVKHPMNKMVEIFCKRRDLTFSILRSIDGFKVYKPQGAFYLFPDVTKFFGKQYKNYTIKNSTDFCRFLLKEGLVSTVMGSAFGDDNCIRFSYATSEENLKKGLLRVKEFVNKLH